jgi:hypothetical protein
VITSGEPGPAVRVYPVVDGAAGRLGQRVTLGLCGGECGHGEAVEAPATVSMPAHPGDAPTVVKEARALADKLLERAEANRVEREAPVLAALARARAGHR